MRAQDHSKWRQFVEIAMLTAGRIRNDDDDDGGGGGGDAHVAVPLRSHPCRCGRGAAVT